jgi:hypothetical protein
VTDTIRCPDCERAVDLPHMCSHHEHPNDATTAPPSPVQPPDDQRCPTCGRGGLERLSGTRVWLAPVRNVSAPWADYPDEPLDPTVLADVVWPGEDAE